MNDSFHKNSNGVKISYNLGDVFPKEFNEKYKIKEKAGCGNDLSRAINILHWISNNIQHNGTKPIPEEIDSLALFDNAWGKGYDFGINCRFLSILLADCLLSIGLFARPLYLMPFSPYDEDNHVVTQVFIRELNKWIMLDPSFDAYVMNQEKEMLNIFEIRDLLSNQEAIIFNDEIRHNDDKWQIDEPYYKEYLAKDSFYIETYEKVGCYNPNNIGKHLYICPENYDLKKSKVLNIQYRTKEVGDSEDMQNWLKNEMVKEYLYIEPSEILKVPYIK
jgi:hypothetical protein